MDEDDRRFYKAQMDVQGLTEDLEYIFKKYKVKRTEQVEYLSVSDDCDGVGTVVDYFEIDGFKWNFSSIPEIISEVIDDVREGV